MIGLCLASSSSGRSWRHGILLLIGLSGRFWSVAHAKCYLPDGTDRNAGLAQEDYQPCDPGDDFSMCCATNREVNPDRCRSDGLCYATYDTNVWRESCTDQSWESPKCFKLCNSGIGSYLEGDTKHLISDDTTITPCDNGSYCCGNGTAADACCSDGKGLFMLDGSPVTAKPSAGNLDAPNESQSASTSPSPSTSTSPGPSTATADSETASSTPSPSPFPSEKPSSSNKTGAIAGGAIGGVIVFGLIVGAFAMIAIRRRDRRPQDHQNTGSPPSQERYGGAKEGGGFPKHGGTTRFGGELEVRREVPELEPLRVRHEMS